MVVYLNGKFLDPRDAKISVFDHGFLFGDGIFETLRAHNGRVWQMEEHLERLYESSKMRGWKLSWTPKEMAEVIGKAVKKFGTGDARIRVTITPGAPVHVSGSTKAAKNPTLFIWVFPLEKLPPAFFRRGVAAITFPLERPFPQMKTTSMQPLLVARAEAARKRAFEALLINRRGEITEGTWTNVFIVKKKRLITPRLGVLPGTTRNMIVKLARPLLRVKMRSFTRRELMNADECFVTNAPKGMVPIVKVDGEKIGTGRVGPVTKHLMEVFEKKVMRRSANS